MYGKKVAMLAMVVCSVVFIRMGTVEASEDIKEILVSGDYEYCILDDGTVQITNFYGTADKIEIPDEIGGKMVSEIWNRAFSDCPNLTGIKIPNSVKEIDDYAFVGCSITDIEVDADNKCFDVIDGVLYDIDEKELIYYPCGFTEEHFSVPQGIEKIGCYAFWGGTSLTSIEIPDSVTEIGYGAFYDCSSLTSIEIPNSVTEIGDNAFHGCENLKITATDGLYAIQYAIDNGLDYEYIGQHDWLNN